MRRYTKKPGCWKITEITKDHTNKYAKPYKTSFPSHALMSVSKWYVVFKFMYYVITYGYVTVYTISVQRHLQICTYSKFHRKQLKQRTVIFSHTWKNHIYHCRHFASWLVTHQETRTGKLTNIINIMRKVENKNRYLNVWKKTENPSGTIYRFFGWR